MGSLFVSILCSLRAHRLGGCSGFMAATSFFLLIWQATIFSLTYQSQITTLYEEKIKGHIPEEY